jgi:hypothetical protein
MGKIGICCMLMVSASYITSHHHAFFSANNLYGSSMTMPMPTGNYRFLEEGDSMLDHIRCYFELVEECHQNEDLEMPDWNVLPQHEGYFIEVDVEYPESRHDYMRDLPPAPAPTTVRQDDLSEHYKHLWRCRYGQDGEIPDSEKLIASLVNKKGKLFQPLLYVNTNFNTILQVLFFTTRQQLSMLVSGAR